MVGGMLGRRRVLAPTSVIPLPSILALTFNIGDNTVAKLQNLQSIVQPLIDSKEPKVIVIALQECVDKLDTMSVEFDGYTIVEGSPVNKRLGGSMGVLTSKFRVSILIFKRTGYDSTVTINNTNLHGLKYSHPSNSKTYFKGYLVVDVLVGDNSFKFVSLHFPFADDSMELLKTYLDHMLNKCALSNIHCIFMGDYNTRFTLTSECIKKNSKKALCSVNPAYEVDGVGEDLPDENYCEFFQGIKPIVDADTHNFDDFLISDSEKIIVQNNLNCSRGHDFKTKKDITLTALGINEDDLYDLENINKFLRANDYFSISLRAVNHRGKDFMFQPVKKGSCITYKFSEDGLVSIDSEGKGRLMAEADRICCCKIDHDWPYTMVSTNIKIDDPEGLNLRNDHLPVVAFMQPVDIIS